MNDLSSELATEPLLFSWDSPRRRQAAFLAFLAISLLAHAVCFYIFQVVYPPADRASATSGPRCFDHSCI